MSLSRTASHSGRSGGASTTIIEHPERSMKRSSA
jgi:hypothetical protein